MTQPTEIPIDQVEQVPPPEPSPEGSEDLSALEVAMTAIVLAALTAWLLKVASAVNRDVRRFGTAPHADEALFLAADWTREVDLKIIPELRDVQRRGWRKVAPARRSYPEANAVMLDELAKARNLLVRIPDEVYALVNAELMASAAAGDDVYHQAARVDRLLNATGSENWPNRAKVIAVTEVNRAYSASILAGGFQAQIDENRPLLKRWDSSNDSRVREWHRAADGQTVPLAAAFDVGPDRLQYPGDPDGLPHNVIHCRCTLDIVDGDEIRGR
jgi:hypothetical protein